MKYQHKFYVQAGRQTVERKRRTGETDVDYTLYHLVIHSSLLLLCTCHKVDHTFCCHLRRIEAGAKKEKVKMRANQKRVLPIKLDRGGGVTYIHLSVNLHASRPQMPDHQ